SVAIVGRETVLVFDTNGTPASAANVLAEIRKITPKPVRYVVNSHWHWDHWYGTEVYKAAFPAAQVIGHEKTKALRAGPASPLNRITSGLGSYPSGWLHTLEYIDALDAAVLIPGHGEPLHDKALLHATRDVLRALLKEGPAARARGLDADQAKEEILPRLHDLM